MNKQSGDVRRRRSSGARRPGAAPGLAALAAGTAAAALLSASAAHPPAGPAPQALSPPTGRHSPPILPTSASRALRSAPAPALEAVAAFVAKKYRVSEVATREFVELARREALRHGLDPLLVIAVIAVESRFNPVAQSDAGALGLMQVVPRFHPDKVPAAGPGSLLVPETNIAIGTRILSDAIRRGGREDEGLQLYNGSPDDPASGYANRVLAERQRLQEALRQPQLRT